MTLFLAVAAAVLVALTPARVRWRPRRPVPRTRRKRAGIAPADDPALALDLLAAAGQAGLPVSSALIEAGAACGGSLGEAMVRAGSSLLLGAEPEQAWVDAAHASAGAREAQGVNVIRDQLVLVAGSGAPGVDLLHAAADGVRRRRRRAAEAAAATLSVRLVLPMGLCALPAFLAFSVVPVVLSLLGSVLG